MRRILHRVSLFARQVMIKVRADPAIIGRAAIAIPSSLSAAMARTTPINVRMAAIIDPKIDHAPILRRAGDIPPSAVEPLP